MMDPVMGQAMARSTAATTLTRAVTVIADAIQIATACRTGPIVTAMAMARATGTTGARTILIAIDD
jgi:hypothetical protein